MNSTLSYAIIGGGISGLSAAWYLHRRAPGARITLFEDGDRLGGVLQTERVGDFLIEQAADMFVAQPDEAMQLCRELGIEDDLITTAPVVDRAFIGLGDDVFPVPQGLSMMVPTLESPILETALLTEEGKQRFLAEHQIDPRDVDGDESLKSFAIRRFGVEAYEKIIQPMVSGIYTADPEKLSMRATMKRFVDMEQSAGSLIAAHREKNASTHNEDVKESKEDQAASGARYSMFRAPAGGIGQLIKALADRLSEFVDVRFNTPVAAIERSDVPSADDGWNVLHGNAVSERFNGVVVATGAQPAARLLENASSDLAQTLSGIETASSAIVVFGINRAQLNKSFGGFGIIYPHIDDGQVIAISFSSNKFAGRCNDDQLLIRVFIGGALQSHLVDLPDDQLVEIAKEQLNKSLGLSGAPLFERVYRWRNCMPQYHLGHTERVEKIMSLVADLPNLELAGNSYNGVGIPACIASGKAAAEKLTFQA